MIDWVPGELLRLALPAHSAALAAGGEAFLTAAFRATGVLATDNRVARITQFQECSGGSTGTKLLLAVEYARPSPELEEKLFVKFSRDFADELRDRGRFQMEREVHFALLSRHPNFPIAVPTCYYADFNQESGTGLLITRRVPFGCAGIEPLYPKCLDHEMPDPLLHYRAILGALGRLAGTHRAGLLPATVEQDFPFDADRLMVSKRQPYSPEQIRRRVSRYAEFAAGFPGLLPANIRSPAFLARLQEEAPRFMALAPVVEDVLRGDPALIALCHWNANVDNAWFWRDAGGDLTCGLLDWGHVSQMNVAMALWGCLSGAETELWNRHLDDLLQHFAAQFRNCGSGVALDIAGLKQHLQLYVAMMGLAWMLDTPALLRARVTGLDSVKDRHDKRIRDDELARSSLQMMINCLNLWETRGMGELMDLLEGS